MKKTNHLIFLMDSEFFLTGTTEEIDKNISKLTRICGFQGKKSFKFVYIPLRVILICVSLYQVCTRNLFLSIFAAELVLGNTRSTSTPEFPVLKVFQVLIYDGAYYIIKF